MKTFPYWKSLKYSCKKDFHLQAISENFQITVNYYLGEHLVWSSQGTFKKLLLEVGTLSTNMISVQTPYKGQEFDDVDELINVIFSYLKEDDEYKKYLRESKLERILKINNNLT